MKYKSLREVTKVEDELKYRIHKFRREKMKAEKKERYCMLQLQQFYEDFPELKREVI